MTAVALLPQLRSAAAQDDPAHTCVYPDQAAAGQVGTRVTILGTNLLGSFHGNEITDVTLAGIQAEIIEGDSASRVVVIAPEGIGSGNIVVRANSGATAVHTDAWTFSLVGEVTSITPAFGQYATRVTIQGDRLLGGGSNASLVRLRGVAATMGSHGAASWRSC